MNDDFVKRALEGAFAAFIDTHRRQQELRREIDDVERQRAKTVIKLVSLARLCDDVPEDTDLARILNKVSQAGLTEVIGSVLMASDVPLSTIQVRDQLIRMGFDLTRFKNPLAAINTVLGRLPKDRVETVQDKETGKTLYHAKRPDLAPWDALASLPRRDAKQIVTDVAKRLVDPEREKKSAAKKSRKTKSSLKV